MKPQFATCTGGRVLYFDSVSSGFGESLVGGGEVAVAVRTCCCNYLVYWIVVRH